MTTPASEAGAPLWIWLPHGGSCFTVSNLLPTSANSQQPQRRVVNKLNQLYSSCMASLSGPHPISAQFQVKIPIKLARELHLQKGDDFFWRRSDDDPDVLILIPAEVVERRYSVGEQAEAVSRPLGAGLATDLPGTASRDVIETPHKSVGSPPASPR